MGRRIVSSASTTRLARLASQSARATAARPAGPSFSAISGESQERVTEPLVMITVSPGPSRSSAAAAAPTGEPPSLARAAL
jgi:hypothetical protein